MRRRLYNMQKTAGHGAKSAYQSDTQLQTADWLSSELGVSAPTIKRDGKFAEAVQRGAIWGVQKLHPQSVSES